jgi:hypothetical protein
MTSTRVPSIGAYIAGILITLIPTSDQALAQRDELLKPLIQVEKEKAEGPDFSKGTGTPSMECGLCHKAIYREYAFGFGTDLTYKPMASQSAKEGLLFLKDGISTTGAAHSIAGIDPWPVQARGHEVGGKPCNVCHYPEPFGLPDMDAPEIARPKPRAQGRETEGVTCASCHLTPDGKVRGPYGASAPHKTVKDPKIQTSVACAHCHSAGKRIIGKSTQTFLEWRDDFFKIGLGSQQCQDCHMMRTLRKLAETGDGLVRPVARHNWTGGHSKQRISSALGLTVVAGEKNQADLKFHVINVGAAHSVPTGSSRRAVFLKTQVVDLEGYVVASNEWMFAPWYGDRPDDSSFLQEDSKRSDAIQAMMADAQGPHETIIRAGEERVLAWTPKLAKGTYTVQSTLIYDLNRYNDPEFKEDQTKLLNTSLPIVVK